MAMHSEPAPPKGGSEKLPIPAVALYVVLFGLLLIAAIWGLTLAQQRRDHAEAVADEFTKIGNLAIAHEAHALRLIQEADQLALLLKDQYERPGPKADLKQWLAQGIIRADTFSFAGVLDEHGDVIAASADFPQRNLADRAFFRFHQSDPSTALRIGEPVQGRASGRWALPMTRRINKPDGSFGGVADVAINVRVFTDMFGAFVLQPSDVLTLVRGDGTILARRTGETTSFGGSLAGSRLMAKQAQAPVGEYAGPSALDNVTRLVSYRRLEDYGVIAAVSSDEQAVMAPVERRAALYYTGASGATLVILAACGLIAAALWRQGRASLAMRASEARYRHLFETARDGILLLNARTARIEDVNPYLAEMLGYTRAQMLGRKLWELGALADIERNKEMFALLQETGYARYEDLPLKTSSGRQIAVEFVSNAYQSDGVKVIQCNIRDITGRAETDRALRQFKAIIEASDDAIISKSLDGTIMSWNPGAEQLFGYTAQEAIGHSMMLIIPPDRLEEEPHILARLAAGEKVDHFETVRMHKDGHLVPISATISPIRDASHKVIGASKIARDITERRQAEAARLSLEGQLRESQKMEAIGTLAGGVAHDFNNILAAILGNTALAREDVSPNNHLALQSLEEIRKAGTRGRDLVQQILSFSRRQPVERKLIDMAEVIDESVRLLRATLPARLRIEVECAPDLPRVMADFSLMQQVIINLATNAMQAMRAGPGHIRIHADTAVLDAALAGQHPGLAAMAARHPGTALRLRLSDTGPGMDAATLARLFEPFFTTKQVGEGTGLGLSVVLGIVLTHEGAILADSRPGQGATFTVYLPPAQSVSASPRPGAADPLALPGAAPLPGAARAEGLRLLYIDDDESLLFLVRRLMERRGFRVSGYADAAEAVERVRAHPRDFDVVVTDYNMPGMSGLDVARALREIRADLPVAIASGLIAEELRAQASEAGVRELIFKATAAESLCDAFTRVAHSVKP